MTFVNLNNSISLFLIQLESWCKFCSFLFAKIVERPQYNVEAENLKITINTGIPNSIVK